MRVTIPSRRDSSFPQIEPKDFIRAQCDNSLQKGLLISTWTHSTSRSAVSDNSLQKGLLISTEASWAFS